MDRNSDVSRWPAELVSFPEWNGEAGSWECSDVGEYEGVRLYSLYVRGCGLDSLQEYYGSLVSAGFTETQPGKFVKTAGGMKLCVDTGSVNPDETGFYIFFSSCRASVPIIVTPRRRLPGWRRDMRRERRSSRRSRRKRNRSVRQQRRQNRRSDRRTRRLSGEK